MHAVRIGRRASQSDVYREQRGCRRCRRSYINEEKGRKRERERGRERSYIRLILVLNEVHQLLEHGKLLAFIIVALVLKRKLGELLQGQHVQI